LVSHVSPRFGTDVIVPEVRSIPTGTIVKKRGRPPRQIPRAAFSLTATDIIITYDFLTVLYGRIIAARLIRVRQVSAAGKVEPYRTAANLIDFCGVATSSSVDDSTRLRDFGIWTYARTPVKILVLVTASRIPVITLPSKEVDVRLADKRVFTGISDGKTTPLTPIAPAVKAIIIITNLLLAVIIVTQFGRRNTAPHATRSSLIPLVTIRTTEVGLPKICVLTAM
jgi:hypothetical protein